MVPWHVDKKELSTGVGWGCFVVSWLFLCSGS